MNNAFSPYQNTLAGLIPRYYGELDIKLLLEKKRKALKNVNNLSQDRIDDYICKIDKNINFIASMLNQRNLERG